MRIVTGVKRSVLPALLLASFVAHAAPLFLEESAQLALPDSTYRLAGYSPPAVGGDSVVLIGFRFQGGESNQDELVHAAFLFERNSAGGSWHFVSKLLETVQDTAGTVTVDMTAAVDGNRLLLSARDRTAGIIRRVYERGPTGWAPVADLSAPPEVEDQGRDSEIEGDTIALGISGRPVQGATAYRRNAQGAWSYIGAAEGAADSCDFCSGPEVDVSGNTMIFNVHVVTPYTVWHAQIWDYAGGTTWSHIASVPDPAKPVAILDAVAIEGDTVIAGASDTVQTDHPVPLPIAMNILEYRRSAGVWSLADEVRTADAFQHRDHGSAIGNVELEGGLLVASLPADSIRGLDTGSAPVFRRNDAGRFEEVARLVASDSAPRLGGVGSEFEISGNRIVVVGPSQPGYDPLRAYVFDLPGNLTQPANVQDDFEDGNSAGWTPLPGSSWSVVTSGASKVFRQSSFSATTDGAILGNTDWTNQAIEADVTLTEISGSDRWGGLAVRYGDANNHYYVTLRSSHTVQLRRMLNGAFVTLASAPHAIALNHTYRVRLEAIGTWLRVYVDGKLIVQARDSTLAHGQAALLSFKARADFDNAIVTPNPALTLLADTFDESGTVATRWSPGLTSDWTLTPPPRVYSQRSTADGARSVTGVATGDQIIRTRARADAFNGTDRWFGLITRFVDDNNYYYVTLRNSNQITLRKLTNGAIQQLDTAPMNVLTGTWYDLRMESVGSKHRVYVNDFLVLEADDATHATGRYGFRTFKTAVSYDDFAAVKP